MAAKLRWKKNELMLGVWCVARVQKGICGHPVVINAYGRWPIEERNFRTITEARVATIPVVLGLLRDAGVKAEGPDAR